MGVVRDIGRIVIDDELIVSEPAVDQEDEDRKSG